MSELVISENVTSRKWLHVVAAVIQNKQEQILIAKRLDHQHQGGLWEFPGGKVEEGETAFSALKRELKEEINIDIHSCRSFLQVRHNYPDKAVFLDIYKVTDFSGQAQGNEGQEVRWISGQELENFEFPKANTKIIKALRTPELLSICQADFDAEFCLSMAMKDRLQKIAALNIDALLLRLPLLSDLQYKTCFAFIAEVLEKSSSNKKIKLLINRFHLFEELKTCAGLHLTAQQLMESTQRPVPSEFLLSASCHNALELEQAKKISCDFVFISPVFATQSHPQVQALTQQDFKNLVQSSELPVLGLGGMHIKHLVDLKQLGAFGIAGISNFGMSD